MLIYGSNNLKIYNYFFLKKKRITRDMKKKCFYNKQYKIVSKNYNAYILNIPLSWKYILVFNKKLKYHLVFLYNKSYFFYFILPNYKYSLSVDNNLNTINVSTFFTHSYIKLF